MDWNTKQHKLTRNQNSFFSSFVPTPTIHVAFLRYLLARLAALETNLFLEIYFFSILSIYHGDDDAWTTKMEREEERVIGSVFWTRQDCLAPKNHTLFHFSLLTFFFSPLSMDVSLPTLRCMSRSWTSETRKTKCLPSSLTCAWNSSKVVSRSLSLWKSNRNRIIEDCTLIPHRN